MPGEVPEETVLPVVEETLRLDKRVVETGRVRVSLSTEVEEEVLRETLRRSHAEVERLPVGREVSEMPRVRQEGNLLIIPVVEEVLVVEKRLVLKEEIHLRLTDEDVAVEQPATRRVQHAVVERVPPASGPADR
jgi:stress response protein YsnF